MIRMRQTWTKMKFYQHNQTFIHYSLLTKQITYQIYLSVYDWKNPSKPERLKAIETMRRFGRILRIKLRKKSTLSIWSRRATTQQRLSRRSWGLSCVNSSLGTKCQRKYQHWQQIQAKKEAKSDKSRPKFLPHSKSLKERVSWIKETSTTNEWLNVWHSKPQRWINNAWCHHKFGTIAWEKLMTATIHHLWSSHQWIIFIRKSPWIKNNFLKS